ncbi:MAG: hypothetical protein F4170_07835 [Rhodobacteraceae bacterium]|nr:hypothetical protein [Paracoccaceae bacterium]
MPLPVALVPALIAGGTLVPHATGGLIVTGASGYVANTFLSTAVLNGLFGAGFFSAGLGTGVLGTLFGGALIGSSGVMGTGIGATGLTGLGISLGLVSTTPVWVPVATIGGGLAIFGASGYLTYKAVKKRRILKDIMEKVQSAPIGEEVVFTEEEAELLDDLLRRMNKEGDLKFEENPDNQ